MTRSTDTTRLGIARPGVPNPGITRLCAVIGLVLLLAGCSITVPFGGGAAPTATAPAASPVAAAPTATAPAPTATPDDRPMVAAEPTGTATVAAEPTAPTATATPTDILFQVEVVRGANIRSRVDVLPETVVAQVCPGDILGVLEEAPSADGGRWYRVRVLQLSEPSCVATHATVGTEAWLNSLLVQETEGTPLAVAPQEEDEQAPRPTLDIRPLPSGLPVVTVPAGLPQPTTPPTSPTPTVPSATPTRPARATAQPTAAPIGDLTGTLIDEVRLRAVRGFLQGATLDPAGERIAAGSSDGSVQVWRVDEGDLQMSVPAAHTDWVRAVAFSPDGTVLASGGDDQTVRLWQVDDSTALATLEGHDDWVRAVAFSPDGTVLASGGDDATVRLWRVEDASLIETLTGHERTVRGVAFSPDNTLLASGGDDATVRLWSASNGNEVATLNGHDEGVTAVAFSPDGQLLASASDDRTVRVWDVRERRLATILRGYPGPVTSIAFSSDGRLLLTNAGNNTVWAWDIAAGRQLTPLRWSQTPDVVGLTPDSQTLLTVSLVAEREAVRRWNTGLPAPLPVPTPTPPVTLPILENPPDTSDAPPDLDPDGVPVAPGSGVVVSNGNFRSAPAFANNVTGQVCAGDQFLVRATQPGWVNVRITVPTTDCIENHVAAGTEGWLSDLLVQLAE